MKLEEEEKSDEEGRKRGKGKKIIETKNRKRREGRCKGSEADGWRASVHVTGEGSD